MDRLSAVMEMKALDGLAMRSAATAENIANAETPAYQPVRVSFEAALAVAARHGPAAVQAVRPRVEPDLAAGADGLRLDLELATATTTTQRYAALADVLSRQLQLDGIAINGNG